MRIRRATSKTGAMRLSQYAKAVFIAFYPFPMSSHETLQQAARQQRNLKEKSFSYLILLNK